MSMTDPIADLLTRIRNGAKSGHESIVVPHSRLKAAVVKLLGDEGFIQGFEEHLEGVQGYIRVHLRYDRERRPVIRGLRRVSAPSRRIYVKRDEIPFVRNGLGIAILTTSQGILTDREARKQGLGGEVLCYVW